MQKRILNYCLITLLTILIFYVVAINNNNFMAEPTWGLLEKSQVDAETIEEAIVRLITAHNDDANAHIGAGKSLDTHKTQVTIDHPADSVVEDKIPNNNVTTDKLLATRFVIRTSFESIDGWDKSAGVSIINLSQVVLQTGAVINTTRSMYLSASDYNELAANPSDSPEFQTTIKLSDTTNQLIYIIQGDPDIPHGWGFKIVNGTLYAWYIDSGEVERTQEITGITLTNWVVLRIVLTSGSDIKFYVDGVLKHTATLNIPTSAAVSLMTYRIKNTAAADRQLAIQDMSYIQDFFD